MGLSALAMAVGTFLSRILGLVREQVFAYLFGASVAMDAFNVAFRIPNLLRDLFAEGALSSALVPTMVRAEKEGGLRLANRVVWQVIRVLFLVTALLAVVGIVFSRELVLLFAPKYASNPEALELTTVLTQVLFPFFPLIAIAAALMATLNTRGRFFVPAFASALFNATSIVVGGALAFAFGHWGLSPIVGMAWGVVAGGLVQALCQVPLLVRSGFQIERAPLSLRDPYLKSVMRLMIPGVVGLAATQVNVLVNTILASGLETGAVSWLNYAFRLMQFPIGLFGVSIAAAALPVFSRAWTSGDRGSAEAALTRSLKQVFAINGPAAAGLGFLAVPIMELIYQRGAFSAADTEASAQALMCYALGLPFYSAVKVMVPACYAIGAVRVAVISSLISVALNLALNLALVGPYGHQGLALGTSATAALNALLLLVLLRGKVRLPFLSLGLAVFKVACVSVVMGFGVFFVQDWLAPSLGRFAVFGSMGIGVVMILGLAKVFRAREIEEMVRFVSKKLLPKSRAR